MNYENSINYQLSNINNITNTYSLNLLFNNLDIDSQDSDLDLSDSSDESDVLENNFNSFSNSNESSESNQTTESEEDEFDKFTLNVEMKKRLNSECVICSEKIKKDDKVSILMCNHYFHRKCIIKWYSKKQNCPICRCDVDIKNNLIDKIEDINGNDQYEKIEKVLKEYLNKIKKFKKTYTNFNKIKKKE
jgi:hypothetical protein